MAAEHNIQEIYDVFNKTRWHGVDNAPNTTYCVVKFPAELGGGVEIFQNDGHHAEGKMIEKVEERIGDYITPYFSELFTEVSSHSPIPLIKSSFIILPCIQVYINYSPCLDCSAMLQTCIRSYKNKNVTINLDIVAAFPYYTRRLSCQQELASCSTPEICSLKSQIRNALENEQGLGLFNKTPELRLRAFNIQDWQIGLPKFLQLARPVGQVRPISDLQYIYEDENCRSRQLQDWCTNYDFRRFAP